MNDLTVNGPFERHDDHDETVTDPKSVANIDVWMVKNEFKVCVSCTLLILFLVVLSTRFDAANHVIAEGSGREYETARHRHHQMGRPRT
jgi:hypothetical protein